MKNKIKDILIRGIKQGILIGIGIAMFYYFTFYPYTGFNFKFLLINIIFGALLGYCIFIGEEISYFLLKSKFSSYDQYLIIWMIHGFLVSVIMFNLVARTFRLFTSNFMPASYIVYGSLGVGIITSVISVFYYALDKQKEAIRLEKENKELAVLEERNRIARELHDSVSQNLFGINLQLNTLETIIDEDIKKSEEIIKVSKKMVEEVQTEMRLMIYELQPINLEEKDFFVAIEDLINLYRSRYDFRISTYLQGDEDLIDDTIQFNLYRILQEALNNIVKHAEASRVDIKLIIKGPKLLKLEINDDGQGFNPEQKESNSHFGLANIKERANQIAGELKLDSKVGEGTTLKVII